MTPEARAVLALRDACAAIAHARKLLGELAAARGLTDSRAAALCDESADALRRAVAAAGGLPGVPQGAPDTGAPQGSPAHMPSIGIWEPQR